MSDQLNRIEQLLQHLQTDVNEMKEKVEELPTREELSSLGNTTNEIAVGLEEKTDQLQVRTFQVEDKAEAGYVVLESLFHGMEDRVANLIRESEERMTERMAQNQLKTNQKFLEMQMGMNSMLQVINQD